MAKCQHTLSILELFYSRLQTELKCKTIKQSFNTSYIFKYTIFFFYWKRKKVKGKKKRKPSQKMRKGNGLKNGINKNNTYRESSGITLEIIIILKVSSLLRKKNEGRGLIPLKISFLRLSLRVFCVFLWKFFLCSLWKKKKIT